jgi:adenosylhomocysteine nucleosidase
MQKIGMIVAMTSELNAMLEKFDKVETFSTLGDRKVLLAKMNGKQIYILESGVGEIFSASATQHLISACGVEAIINFGVCGSLCKKHGLKKTVFLSSVVHYEMDTTAIDDVEVGTYCFLPTREIPTTGELLEVAKRLNPEIECVVCASGNKFVADQNEKQYLNTTFGADVCEMESAGVLLACLNMEVPCLIVKAISDGKGGVEEFKQMVTHASQQYVEFVQKLSEIL